MIYIMSGSSKKNALEQGFKEASKDSGCEDSWVLREKIAEFAGAPCMAGESMVGESFSGGGAATASEPKEMVRTQIYLTPQQRDFLRSEGLRRGVSMAAAIRAMVEEKMRPGGGGWVGSPLLEATAEDATFQSDGHGSVGSDQNIYGSYQG